jgi:threonine/homoserine/homoserine lactone efflux protein
LLDYVGKHAWRATQGARFEQHFVVAVASLLATPGPTNALLTTPDALVGVRRSLPLMSAEIACYGTSISLLLRGEGALLAAYPFAAYAVHGASSST